MNRRQVKKGKREFNHATSPLLIICAGLVAFWMVYYITWVIIWYLDIYPKKILKIAATKTTP